MICVWEDGSAHPQHNFVDGAGDPVDKCTGCGESKSNETLTREQKLEAAAKRAIPWLVLLGDFVGNGIKGDENGRCDAIMALRDALGPAADDVVNGYPGENPANWRPR